jgi:hypothetical protein
MLSPLQQQLARLQLQRQLQRSGSSASLPKALQHSSPTFGDLPHVLLVHVLSFVELRVRLGRCSLVCRAWHAAAAEATSTVMVRMQGACNSDDDCSEDLWELDSEEEAEVVASTGSAGVLQQWLAARAAFTTQISIKGPKVKDGSPADAHMPLQLPFAQLQQLLSLTCCNAQLHEMKPGSGNTAGLQQLQDMPGAVQRAPSHTSAAAYTSGSSSSSNGSSSSSINSSSSSCSTILLDASLPSLTKLTALHLRRVNYCCRGGLAALSTLTGLQQLQLIEFPEHDTEQQAAGHDQQHQLDYLPLLTQLTRMHLDVSLLPQGAVGVFSGLQRLQELTLEGEVSVSLDLLQGLPASVAKLRLFLDMQQQFSISTVPALAQLQALQHLEVCDGSAPNWQLDVVPVGISVDVLLSLRHLEQLQVLDLQGRMGSNTACTLMSVVPCLTKLRHMRLCLYDRGVDQAPEHVSDVTQYSALLPPGPHLTHFSLTANRAWMLSAGCGTHMVGDGRQLPQLKVLELGPFAFESCEPVEHYAYFSGATHADLDTLAACFGPGDVERLVCCCPVLEHLWMPGLVQAGVDVSALLQLTALTGLFIGGAVWNNEVAVSVLAGMTRLQELQLCDAPGFTDEGLLALSALTCLTKLAVLSCKLSSTLPTFLNGIQTADEHEDDDEDEEEGCFMLWRQVRCVIDCG